MYQKIKIKKYIKKLCILNKINKNMFRMYQKIKIKNIIINYAHFI